MSHRTKPPFRADHVGSLLRPKKLLDARADHQSGRLDDAGLRQIEDDSIREVVALQEGAGLKAITDGEFRRDIWHYDFLCGLDGIELRTDSQGPSFSGGHAAQSVEIHAKIENPNGVQLDHFKFLKETTNETAKFCVPSPNLAYHRGGRALISEAVYPNLTDFWSDLCAAYARELELLYDAGCRYMQLDDTTFAMLCDKRVRQNMMDRGDDPDELVAIYSKAIGDAISGRPDDLTVTVHMCRGNFQSQWIAEGGYEPVAETMFANTPVDGFFMEWDTDRAGGFEPLQFVSDGQVVVLGLVTSKHPELEAKDDLKRRIDEAAQFVPLENLCLSPQCGFASTHQGNNLTEAEEHRKLELIVEVADEVWG